ncbi:DUF2147 domain-containing protein [Winogradskyella maritima]|uniref:DUF2147 domain-containing protein n=1 Tax=Winogradskyella maritima TaxID=1517766 RepID=A0ABV8ACA0_9FLAO|nr:DUF2147 domain-containing protein [Winogradskyella maritima]
MKHLQILCFFLFMSTLNAQSIIGTWKTIDDETGQAKSVVKIFERDGKIYGKIVEVLNAKSQNPVCSECSGKNKDKPIVGMEIIEGLSQNDEVYDGGTILNPSNGKSYKCRLKLEDNPDELQVRGYVAFFYKTQYWKRVK